MTRAKPRFIPRSAFRAVFLGSLFCLASSLRATEIDLFAGLFGKPSHVSREDLRRGKGKENSGYRISLCFPPAGAAWDAFRKALPAIAEKRLRMEGYEVVISRSVALDLNLPATCNIVVRKKGKMLYFSSLAIDGGENGCFLTYEVNTEPAPPIP